MHVALNQVTIDKLHAFGRRRKMLIAVRGFCAGVVALLGVMSVVALLDRFVVLGDTTRLVLSAAGYLIVVGVVWLTCVRMIMRIPNERELARLVETVSPELREDLISAVELGAPDSDARYDSETFRSLLQQDVAAKMEAVKIERVLPPGLVAKWVRFACLVLTLCVGLMLIPGLEFGNMLTRALMPMANVDRVSSIRVKLIAPNPADPLVPHNEAVDIVIEHIAGDKPDSVVLETFRPEEGREDESLIMKPTGTANQYAATVQIGREPVTYRVLAGDAVTRKYTITTAARPHVDAFTKTYRYPQYTRRPDQTIHDTHGDIRALTGVTVDLVMKTDQPVTSGELRIESPGKPMRTMPLTISNENELRAAVPVESTATYKVHLVGKDTGFSNPFDPQYEIVADPDKAPIVEMRQPLQNLLMPGDEIVHMFAVATDDLGLDTVAQKIRVNDGRWIEVVVAENAGTDVQLRRNMDLFDLAVKPGDRVQTRFAATDFAGNKAESQVITVTVSSSGFDPNRFGAIKAKQQAYAALAALNKTANDYSLTVRQNGQRVNGGDLERRQALANIADAADQIQASADEALTRVTEALRLNSSGSEAYDLALVGRVVSRVKDDWAVTIAGAAARAAATTDAEVINAEAERAQQAVVAAAQALTQAEIGFRNLLASDEADAVLRDLVSLSADQQRIDPARWPDDVDTWQRLARRQSAVATQLHLVDEIADKLVTHSQGRSFEAIRDARAAWTQPRKVAEQALAAQNVDASFGPIIKQMTAGLAQAQQLVMAAAKELAEVAAVDGRARIESAVGMQASRIQATHTSAGEAYDAQQVLLDQRARGVGDAAMARVQAAADATKARNAGTWQGTIDHMKQTSTLNESRSDSDPQFIADMGLTRRALQALRVKYDSDEAREAVASLRVIAGAFRVLEAGHGVAELHASVKSQAGSEKWLRSPADASTTHPRDWDWASLHMKHIGAQLRDADLPAAAVELLEQTRTSDQAGRIGREMTRRRATGEAPDKQDSDLDAIAKQLAQVHKLIEEDMAAARRLIAAQSPTLPQILAKLADDADALSRDADLAKENVADDVKPDDASKKEVEQLAEKQESLKQQLEDVADALRENANVQDVFTDEGRENARDADDALAMIRKPAEQAEQATQQAEAQVKNDQQPEASLEKAAEQDQQLAKNLRQLAEHFENVEQGKGEQTRTALRDAEQELGVKRDLDKEFGRMEKLADIAKLDPAAQLQELEKELAKNPAMKRELSDIARDAVADARDELNEAAAQEKKIAQDLNAADANDQQLKPQVKQRLQEIAQQAEQMAVNEVAKVAEHSLKGAPNAQKPLADAMKALEQAGKAIDPQKNDNANQPANNNAELAKQAQKLQDELQKAADNLDQANQQASKDADNIRKQERDATAQLALGNSTPEERIAAANTIKDAPKQQDAARATRDAAEVVAKDAQKLADEAAQLAKGLQQVAEQDANNLERAAKQQQPIGDAVAKAEDNVARAARHEERLGNEKTTQQLDKANADIKQAGENVAKAEQQLARSDSKAGEQAVRQAEKALDEQRQNLDDILGQPQPRYSDENGNPLPNAPQGNPLPDEPQNGDPQNGDPQNGDPKNSDPKNGDPKQGDPKAGDNKAGQPKGGEPKGGEPKGGQPKGGEPKGGEPKGGSPEGGQPKGGKPEGGSPANDPNQFADKGQGQMERAMKNAADALEAGKQSPQDQAAAKWMARALDELDQAVNPSAPSKSMAANQPQPGQGEPGQGQPGQGEPGQGEPGQGEPGQGQPDQGQPGQPGQGQPGQGQPGQAAMAQAAEAVRQAAQAQAQAMAQARQAGMTPGQQGQPGQGQPGQGQPMPAGAMQPGQGMAQGQPGQGQPGQQPGQQPAGQGQQSGQGAAVAANGQAAGQLPDRAAIARGDWGKLPPKLAEDLLEGQRNGVAPEYRDPVEAYFRAIAKKARESKNSNE